ncbi:MAG: hypothetical protein HDR36_06190 [Treponema sp.]|nr:hypothetical protein [Treponema sp.]
MSKIGEFFDKLEERLEGKKRSRMEKGMGVYTSRKIAAALTCVGIDLLVLIIEITGADTDLLVDYCFIIPLMIIGYIAAEICIHYLDKRIKAQETEELAEDLEDDIARIAYIIAIVAAMIPCTLACVYIIKD